jgi:hypothetical protein
VDVISSDQYRQNASVPEECFEGWPLPKILTQQRPSNVSDAAEAWKAFSCLMADPV